MSDDLRLRDGAIGIATSGAWCGHVVLLERFTDHSWLLYWRDPEVGDSGMRVGIDAGDMLLPSDDEARFWLCEEAGVRWLSEDEAHDLRQRFFAYEEPLGSMITSRLRDWLGRRRSARRTSA